jgi:glycosyltransferase involved in cell wall biosynthesis
MLVSAQTPLTLVLDHSRVLESGSSQLFFKLTEYFSEPVRTELLWEPQWSPATNLLTRIYRSRVLRYFRTRSRLAGAVFALLAYRVLLPRYERELGRKYAGVPLRGIWSPSHELLPLLAMALARRFRCPFHVSLFDVPHTFSLQKSELVLLERGFAEWMREADSVDFASPEMWRSCWHLRIGKEGRDIAIWSSAGVAAGQARPVCARNRIARIAFCGSLRFFREIESLSDALLLLERRCGCKIVLRLFSSKRLSLPAVENLGFIADPAQLAVALQECDLAYSPLSLAAKDRLLVETSFPGKITTYLQAALPILAHAPSSAANYRFIVGNEVGIGIDTADPEAIAQRIQEYSEAVELRERHAQNCHAALKRFFAPEERAAFFSQLFAPPILARAQGER